MINVIKTFNELFAFMEKEKHWFTMLGVIYIKAATPGSPSLIAQRKSLICYAEKLGLKHAFIQEETRSARSKFKAIVEFYDEHTIKGSCPVLIVERFDRLTRDSQDVKTMFDLINNKALEVHLVQGNRVLSDKSSSSDFLVIYIDCAIRFFARRHRAQQRRHLVSGKCSDVE